MDFVELLFSNGPYVAICLIIAFTLTALKRSFTGFFSSPWGLRILYFAPAILGALLGLLLPEESLKLQLLYGAACGTVSQSLYGIVTKALKSKAEMVERVAKKSVDLDKYREVVEVEDND